MKSKFIRVLTFVLCLAMLIGSMSVFTVTAAGTAEMDITAIFDNGLSYTVPASKYSGDSWNFFYYASVGFDSSLTDKQFKSFTVTWDNGGATGSSEVQMYPQGVVSVLYAVVWGVPAPSALVDGATFKIAAGTATNSDTGTTMQLNNDVTMKWNATTQAWEFVPTANYQAGILAVSGNGGGASHIYTVSNDSVPYNGSWAYRYYPYGSYGTMEFIHNGVATPISDGYFQKFSAADYYFNLGSTSASVGDQVRLSGVFACHDFTKQGQGGFYPYIFADVRPITYTYTGSTWTYEVEAVYDQLAFNGFAWSPNVPGADWWHLYLKVDGTIPGEANVTKFANTLTLSVKNSSGVTVLDHATPSEISYQGHEDGTLLFCIPVSALPAASVDVGSLFTLHAGKAKSTTTGVNGIEITKDYTIEYTGSGFTNYVAYNYTDLSILNFIKREGNGIYFATDNDYPDNWDKYVGLQISLNGGEKINKYVGNAGRGSKQMVIDLTDAEWATVTAGSTLTIYAGEAKSIDGADYDGDGVADAIRLVETCTFVYKNGGFELYVPSADVTINDVKDGGYNASANYWDIYLKASVNGLVGNWDVAYNDIVVLVNGEVLNGGYNIKYTPGNDINVFINTGYVTPTIGTKITLKAGISNASNGGLAMNLTADFTMVWDGSVMVAEGNYIDRTTYTVYTGDLTVAGAQIPGEYNNYQLYLKGSAGLAGYLTNGSWAYKLKPLDAQSGIFVNGNRVGGQILKYDDTPNYWFAEGFTANEGDTVTIKGTFYNDDQQVKVVIAEGSFVWNGNGYDVAPMTTAVEKDVNADGEVNALDVVWMTRYLADPAVGISNKGDINGDGKINATDLRILRRYVLGINIVVENGVAQGVPYYAGGEMLKAAYVAPEFSIYVDKNGNPVPYDDKGNEPYSYVAKSDDEIRRMFKEYKDAGFTHIVTERRAYQTTEALDHPSNHALYKCLEIAEEFDLKVIAYNTLLHSLLRDEGFLTNGPHAHNWRDLMTVYINKLKEYPAFWGYMMADEPNNDMYNEYNTVMSWMRTAHPDVGMWVSYYPIEVQNVEQEGVTDTIESDADYKEYITNFGKAQGHFVYDKYAMVEQGSYKSVDENWLKNLNMVAELGRDNGFTTGITLQSVALGTSSWRAEARREITDKIEVSYQIYTAFAFGMTELNFFTYAQHWGAGTEPMIADTAMLKGDGTKNETYTAVQEALAQITAMEAALRNFKWQGTIGLATTNTFFLQSTLYKNMGSSYTVNNNSRLDAAKTTNAEAIVGCLKDEIDGFDGYMIASIGEPTRSGSAAQVTLTFNNATKAMVYWADGSVSTVNLTNGAYTFSVGGGEGCFVIPMV